MLMFKHLCFFACSGLLRRSVPLYPFPLSHPLTPFSAFHTSSSEKLWLLWQSLSMLALSWLAPSIYLYTLQKLCSFCCFWLPCLISKAVYFPEPSVELHSWCALWIFYKSVQLLDLSPSHAWMIEKHFRKLNDYLMRDFVSATDVTAIAISSSRYSTPSEE